MSALPVRPLPHCPNPRRVKAEDRFTGPYIAEVCDCPHEQVATWRVHWIHDDGREMHCPCGPHQPLHPSKGDTTYMVAVTGGYACQSCAQNLSGRHRVRRLEASLFCCYCDGVAERGSGWLVRGHPVLGVPGART